jgi:hypothetical protein
MRARPDHPLTLIACRTVAGGYLGTGRTGEAIALYEHAVRDSERVLGPNHPDTRDAHTALAHARNYRHQAKPRWPWRQRP